MGVAYDLCRGSVVSKHRTDPYELTPDVLWLGTEDYSEIPSQEGRYNVNVVLRPFPRSSEVC